MFGAYIKESGLSFVVRYLELRTVLTYPMALGCHQDGTSPYFGAVVGRVANRIARGTFTLDGERLNLPVNNGPNTLHGQSRVLTSSN